MFNKTKTKMGEGERLKMREIGEYREMKRERDQKRKRDRRRDKLKERRIT